MIDNLIERMIDETESLDSSDSISWKAYREAEKIKDESQIPYLIELIEKLKNKRSRQDRVKREAVYFILKWIGINTSNRQVPEIFFKCLSFETNMHTVGDLLDYIRVQNDFIPDYREIIQFLEDKRWQIRFPAIDLLGKCKEPEVENELINLLETSNDPDEVLCICNALQNIGTEKSIPFLIEKTKHKNQWVRSAAYETLYIIGDSELLHVFLEGLNDRFYCSKHNALIGVCKFDDGKYVDLVFRSVNKILSYNRILDADETKPTDLIEGMKYLNKYMENKGEMEKLLGKINRTNVKDLRKEVFIGDTFDVKE
ncbi:hypothetical protein J6TS2_40210 [Heyndrickxia sporothermodurans]|nr:hypothetical protein J6TS2_40210 [Heyndrickxia sporothermodurans]